MILLASFGIWGLVVLVGLLDCPHWDAKLCFDCAETHLWPLGGSGWKRWEAVGSLGGTLKFRPCFATEVVSKWATSKYHAGLNHLNLSHPQNNLSILILWEKTTWLACFRKKHFAAGWDHCQSHAIHSRDHYLVWFSHSCIVFRSVLYIHLW